VTGLPDKAALAVLGSLLLATAGRGAEPASVARPATDYTKLPGIVDASGVVPGLLVELKYATPDNFAGKRLYHDLAACYLQTDVAQQLVAAAAQLKTRRPELRLLAYDCLRPRSAQLDMWKAVAGTPQQSYVANPHGKMGSLHNYGCAVDLTLAAADGSALDMGTPFDFMGRAAQPRHELTLLKEGKMSAEQVGNRLLLREVMVRAGFIPLNNEWWHFNCTTAAEVRRRYKIVQ